MVGKEGLVEGEWAAQARDLIGLVSVCRREKILFCSVLVERELEGNIKLSAG